ncbi:hypothetical protein CL619_01625 [archaeon]|nr:hypothetical protein [archaeon]|tara:strand:- start:6195 stop:6905 length:711 start_codon:yes stop_codon:yes gene_type:complete
MSLATILLGTSLAFGAAGAPGVYNPDSQTCSGYVERTAPQIIAEYKLGERDFDCTEIPKVRGKRVSPFNTERNFARADLSGASFRGSEMPQTNWEGAQLEGADFEGADLSNSFLIVNAGPDEEGVPANFSHSTLRCSTVEGTFVRADFSYANLNCPGDAYTRIIDGNFSYVDFTGARFDDDTYFPDAADLLCVEMPERDIKKLREGGYKPQRRSVRIGQIMCPEEAEELNSVVDTR